MKSIFGTQDFQNSFVDIFKTFNVFNSSPEAKKGNVQDLQVKKYFFPNIFFKKDNNIGRRVFQITGNVQASNFLMIPDPCLDVKSLNLSGRYVYFIQF